MEWLLCLLVLAGFWVLTEIQNHLHLRRLLAMHEEHAAKVSSSNTALQESMDRNAASTDRFLRALQDRDAQAWLAEVTHAKNWLRINGSN